MKKTIYLHIGTSKTGTTSLQFFLYKNKEVLEKKGILYPFSKVQVNDQERMALLSNIRAMMTEGYNVVGKSMFIKYKDEFSRWNQKITPQERYNAYKKAFDEHYADLINNSNCDKILFSDEIFTSNFNLIELCNVLVDEGFDLKIIVYIRRTPEYIVSVWGESVKTQSGHTSFTFDEFLKLPVIVYDTDLKQLVEKLGTENVIIRPFEKSQWKNGDMVEDFLNCIGLTLDNDFEPLGRFVNKSCNRNQVELFSLINLLDLPNEVLDQCWEKDRALPQDSRKLIETFSDQQIEYLNNNFAPLLKDIAAMYGKKSFFEQEMPDCYGKERPVCDKVTFSREEIEILRDALKISLQEKRQLKDIVATPADPNNTASVANRQIIKKCRPFLQVKYYYYRVLSHLAFAKTKEKLQERKRYYKQLLNI
ncbi:MAG: hypothetical protein ILP11_01020 [Alphaproteobacteria bacterium]|nr:hypothetical protein [Alphaproteobacteria bacterium]